MRKGLLTFLLLITISFFGCVSNPDEGSTTDTIIEEGIKPMTVTVSDNSFCGTWASSQYLTDSGCMPSTSLENSSLRQIVRTSINGNVIRLKFSNRLGESDLVIKTVHIALATGGSSIDSTTDTIVLFNGKSGVTIPAYSEIYSDAFEFNLPSLTNVAVTIYFGSVPDKLTGHAGSRTTSYIVLGNQVSEENFILATKEEHWYVFSGIDVSSEIESKSVVCFGDSITDGRGSTTDAQNRWTDNLATILQSDDSTKNIGVLNEGIGGTLVCYSGSERFTRDVLSQNNAKYIIILYGINDIIYTDSKSDSIISTYKNLISKAHAAGIFIYGGTILPFGNFSDYTEARETVRKEVNEWIKNTSSEEGGFDSYIDFDKAMKDSSDETKMLKEYNCGDGLHPSAAGYLKMAQTVDTTLLTKTGDFSSYKNLTVTNATCFYYDLPSTLTKGKSMQVHVSGKNTGSTGFRSWLIDDNQTTLSNVYSDSTYDKLSSEFNLAYSLTATGTVTKLFFKGPVYGTNIEGVTVESLSVTIDGTTTEITPSLATVN